ncbi:phosphoribosylglycinamide formyltransferase 2 [Streptomyces olivaceoviridis]|uniref:preATP grasp domain-containing protein n=1 Tax=Streptomyces olivaceoviridis TaxID=1921 RepID=UPI0019C04BD6|nr:ATP-grasp domain-containing protein [Streptomyces olivaceoviridis]GGZ09269.1 phosphoribosylglycinamide formyltransferase 2 [Streptomyces olivaceoviridis]
MRTLSDPVLAGLRTALTGASDRPLVLVGNFEVEEHWGASEPGLPHMAMNGSRAIVNHMDELALSLAGAGDYVLLKAAPDPEFLAYLHGLGLAVPTVLTPRAPDPARTVTQDALADPDLLATLRGLAAVRAHLWAHGISEDEERLTVGCGLRAAGPTAAVCKRVNSKIYSRLTADRLGIPQPAGMVCRDADEFDAACERAASWLGAGRPVVLKDAYGVSGKGLLVVRDEARLRQVRRLIARRAQRSGNRRLGLVMEEWLPKRTDLNYQFTVGRDGSVRYDFVKEALTEGGSHQGHRMPVRLTEAQSDGVREAAHALGGALAADGYFGVVGVDGLITEDDRLYPVLEINARNNMSTYQERLRAMFFDADQTALAKRYPVRLRRRLPFGELRALLDGLLLVDGTDGGVLINCFATVNAGAPADGSSPGETFEGRLYAVVVAGSPSRAEALDRELARRLGTLAGRPVTG